VKTQMDKTGGGGRGVRWKMEDLPPSLLRQVEAKLGMRRPMVELPAPAAERQRRGPSKTETDYRRQVLDTNPAIRSVWYEGLTFRLANGHRYTPDWVCLDVSGKVLCIEVKGGYRLGSYQRARLAFDQAAIEHPWAVWIWAENRNGEWRRGQPPRHTRNMNSQ